MFDFTGVQRDDVEIALATAITLGVASFATSGHDGLTSRLLSATLMTAVAALTVLLLAALE